MRLLLQHGSGRADKKERDRQRALEVSDRNALLKRVPSLPFSEEEFTEGRFSMLFLAGLRRTSPGRQGKGRSSCTSDSRTSRPR